MADWIIVMSEDNWDVCARARLLGLGRGGERRLDRLTTGDRVWVYINKKYVDQQRPKIGRVKSVVKITGSTRFLDNPPWRSRRGQSFAYVRSIRIESHVDVPREKVMQLSFARGRGSGWGWPLLNAPLRLTADDVRRLGVDLVRE